MVDPNLTLYLGIDFGLTPAAVFLQQVASGQWVAFDEIVTEDMGAVRFAEVIAPRLRGPYKNLEIVATGDPAGEQRSQVDESTPFDVLFAAGIPADPAHTNDFTLRREAVAKQLSRLTMTGEPGLIIGPGCPQLRKAMAGGYKYKRLQVAGDERFHEKPDKNKYSHVAEAMQYALVGAGEADNVIRVPNYRPGKVRKAANFR